MLLFSMLSIKGILEMGKEYAFPRPKTCLREGCGSCRVWGHGFVEAWFEGYGKPVWLKRYICADCGCVYTIRPFGYWPRHRVPARIIFRSLCHRIEHGKWEKGVFTKQRQVNWLKALRKNIKIHLGMSFAGDVIEGFFELLHGGRIPVLRPG